MKFWPRIAETLADRVRYPNAQVASINHKTGLARFISGALVTISDKFRYPSCVPLWHWIAIYFLRNSFPRKPVSD
jgi:hypothetical protein